MPLTTKLKEGNDRINEYINSLQYCYGVIKNIVSPRSLSRFSDCINKQTANVSSEGVVSDLFWNNRKLRYSHFKSGESSGNPSLAN